MENTIPPQTIHPRRELNSTALISLLAIIGCSAATLIKQTKDDAWFEQNVVVGVSNDNVWLTVGSYKTRFGWQQVCYRLDNVGSWTCDKYSHLGNDGNALQLLGKMTYLGAMISVGLASVVFLSLLASRQRPFEKLSKRMIGIMSMVMFMYYVSVTMVSFPVMTSNFLDEMDLAEHVSVQWAYGLSLIATALWMVVGCMHR